MTKIKVVQIALAGNTENADSAEYLDDKGRVWYLTSRREKVVGGYDSDYTYINEWKQVDLPDEPQL